MEIAIHHKGEECLPWPFSEAAAGYGRIVVDGKHTLAHRHVCTLVHGEPPTPKHEAAHSCGKGHEACVSGDHLSWKTHADNQADRLIHGTSNRGKKYRKLTVFKGESA
jgi:hypothetical protein